MNALKHWLEDRDIKFHEFYRRVEKAAFELSTKMVSSDALRKWISGERSPSKNYFPVLVLATDGEITPNSLLLPSIKEGCVNPATLTQKSNIARKKIRRPSK